MLILSIKNDDVWLEYGKLLHTFTYNSVQAICKTINVVLIQTIGEVWSFRIIVPLSLIKSVGM